MNTLFFSKKVKKKKKVSINDSIFFTGNCKLKLINFPLINLLSITTNLKLSEKSRSKYLPAAFSIDRYACIRTILQLSRGCIHLCICEVIYIIRIPDLYVQ